MMEKEKIINAFNNAWNKKIASENSYGKLARKEIFENKEEIKTEISTDCSYYKDVVNGAELKRQLDKIQESLNEENAVQKLLKRIDELKQENKQMEAALEEINKIAEPRFVNGLNEEADLCNLAMDRIQNKINEVLQ